MVQIDFSENFSCKYDREVQSAHFGGSKGQVSLHTGILYLGPGPTPRVVGFCSISDNTDHTPAGIWAHLKPVLQKHCPPAKVKKLHFVSDGPTSQYRNKSNFATTMQHHINNTYKRTTWNFLESGHGKGPADGIGAAIKRNADAYIASSNTVAGENRAIVDAATMYRALIRQGTTLDLFLIDEEEFQASSAQLRSMNPNGVPGTMKLHQVIFDKPGTIKYRDVSCFCDNCEHDFTQFQLLDKVDKSTDENNNVINKDR